MLQKAEIFWFYFAGFVAIFLSLIIGSMDLYIVPVIPITLFFIYTLIFHPTKTLWAIVFLVPLSVNTMDVGMGLSISLPTEPLIILLFGMLVLKVLMGSRIPKEILKHPVTILVLINLVWIFCSSFFSTDPLVSFKYSLARTWFVSIFYLFMVFLFKDFKNIKSFITAFCLGFVALAIYTGAQLVMEGFVLSHNFYIMAPFYPDHTMYSASLAFALPMLAVLFFYAIKLKDTFLRKGILAIGFAIVLIGIIFAFSRAAWISVAGSAALLVFLVFKIKFRFVILGLALVSIFAIVKQDSIMYKLSANKQGSVSEFEGHVESIGNVSTDPSNLERINRWLSGYEMFKERPIFGFGPGTYVNEYGAYQATKDLTLISTFSGDLGNAHSEYISALSETGLIGFLSWAGIFLVTVYYGFRLYYYQKGKVRIYALGALLSLCTYYCHGFLNNYSDFDKIAMPLWGLTAVIVGLDIYHREKTVSQQS